MTIEAVAFLIGGILIGTAIIGGGFEIKEIKMPRVGAGVRIVSLIAGSGFLFLALSMWGVNHPELLAEQVPASSLAPRNDTAAAGTQPGSQAGSEESSRTVARETAPAPEQPTWQSETPATAFSGFSGKNQVVWDIDGLTYYGTVSFSGATGFLRVAFIDPESGAELRVDQDLVLQESDGTFWYAGANPKDASTGQLLAEDEYAPDNLRVAADGHGGWTLAEVCDVRACWPVSVQ